VEDTKQDMVQDMVLAVARIVATLGQEWVQEQGVLSVQPAELVVEVEAEVGDLRTLVTGKVLTPRRRLTSTWVVAVTSM